MAVGRKWLIVCVISSACFWCVAVVVEFWGDDRTRLTKGLQCDRVQFYGGSYSHPTFIKLC